MSRETVQLLRVPILVGLIAMLAVAAMALARMDDRGEGTEPLPSLVVGAPGGGIITTATPTAVPSSTPPPSSAAPTAQPSSSTPTPSPTPAPPDAESFRADVLACEEISGSECIGEMERIGPNDESVIALVTFDGAAAGDVLDAVLTGNGRTIQAGAYTLQGGGSGYYYATLSVDDLPAGEYTLTAIRNGEPVASRGLRRVGNGG